MPREASFPWSTENVFGLIKIFSRSKHSKVKTFSRKCFMSKQTGPKFHANYNVRVFNFLFLAVENKCGIYGFYFNGLQDKFLEQFTKDAHVCCVQDRKKTLGYKHLCNVSIFSFSMFVLIKQHM
jgi:hypothetical protein